MWSEITFLSDIWTWSIVLVIFGEKNVPRRENNKYKIPKLGECLMPSGGNRNPRCGGKGAWEDWQKARAEGQSGTRAPRDLEAILRTFDFFPMRWSATQSVEQSRDVLCILKRSLRQLLCEETPRMNWKDYVKGYLFTVAKEIILLYNMVDSVVLRIGKAQSSFNT